MSYYHIVSRFALLAICVGCLLIFVRQDTQALESSHAYIPQLGQTTREVAIADSNEKSSAVIFTQRQEIASSFQATHIAAGDHHTCALTIGGSIKCWGANSWGQLGDGTTMPQHTPVDVIGLSDGVSAISAGDSHTCTLTTGGGVKCWGANSWGQLGDGTTMPQHTPVDVAALADDVTAIAAGGSHTCALTSRGKVKCWGINSYGQLGDGTTTYRNIPVNVTGLASGIIAVAGGWHHTCALTSEGGVKCWGSNYRGQLGDGTTTDRHVPTYVIGLSSGVTAIAAGDNHTCAVTAEGSVKCWGYNESGQLGDGTTTDQDTPMDVTGLINNITGITAGLFHTCALTIEGTVKCWGDNSFGRLGDGTNIKRYTPVTVIGFAGGITEIAAGGGHTCALAPEGGVKCWGNNFNGELGDGTATGQYTPVNVIGLTSGVTAIGAGLRHTCALTSEGGVKCWGDNDRGELGDGTITRQYTPVDVIGLANNVTAIDTGYDHACALTIGGGVKCWGENFWGQLGDGTTIDRYTPIDVTGLSGNISAIATGGAHTCGLTSGGNAKCWGNNSRGQLGDGTTTDRRVPANVIDLSSGISKIATGGGHTCVLTSEGGVKCWGDNESGQLGDGTTTDRHVPTNVIGLSSGVTAITAGFLHTCALTSEGAVKCWGWNDAAQLGDGTTTDRYTPVDVTGLASGVTAISGGYTSTCAVTEGGGVKCWGLEDGKATNQYTPVDVTGLASGIIAVAGGWLHTCALTNGGGVKCWGYNEDGQLGINPGWTPVTVTGTAASNTEDLELLEPLSIGAEDNNWPPDSGDKIIAHISVHNGSTQPVQVQNIGVRGRRNGSELWDIGFWAVTIEAGQTWTINANNERPLEPGSYSFRVSYSLDGSTWTEIGNEVNFTVTDSPVLPDPLQSTVEAFPTTLPANGSASAQVTATLKTADGVILPARRVQYYTDRGFDSIIAAADTTDQNGQVVATLSSSMPGKAKIQVLDVESNVVIGEVDIEFVDCSGTGDLNLLCTIDATVKQATNMLDNVAISGDRILDEFKYFRPALFEKELELISGVLIDSVSLWKERVRPGQVKSLSEWIAPGWTVTANAPYWASPQLCKVGKAAIDDATNLIGDMAYQKLAHLGLNYGMFLLLAQKNNKCFDGHDCCRRD